ncbi:coagulation factor 5/8 type domain protein [Desulfofarcimen acetoxidans DSM 771]|uniref:Coagulation factor 5/8 type domain protein n=1 Tax=Desulfofarcimen acetoxidans (strain ATCC 49208 / DSM 771 / KCTC 5769 / VKM B-1644 / 5575) TaxID=485916 RepID=C8W098_DESAS|nr:cadherin-like beta sandwich domain-containing protein [Desulfofarcimen acetoxidans]ACV63153.1 coagulation factor 5/8 type domain protein [Desulfofarcimen acetoxidans DSM 771]
MSNIALKKAAGANSFVYPYIPAKAVDGVVTPLNRWLGTSPIPPSPGVPVPNWLSVDLGANFWVSRWVVKQLGGVGWSTNYNLVDYKFQGSLDNSNWFDLDSVTDNSLNCTDRTITPYKVRWVRVYITKGLRCNTNFASIAEFEVYDAPPTDSTLSALSLNSGAAVIPINPPFAKTTVAYTASVGFDTENITVMPTTTDPNATVEVNGVPVLWGQSSQPVSLTAEGITPVNIVVTPVIGEPQTYTVNVTRASSPYLSGLAIKSGRTTLTLSPPFNRNTFEYTATAGVITSVLITATAEDTGATIEIKGNPATSGVALTVPVSTGSNPIDIVVSSVFGTDQKTYLCTINVGS